MVSRQLAEVMAHTRFSDLPEQVVIDTERSILDWLGSALAGAFEAPARMARAVISGFGQSTECTVFPNTRASAPVAALANGVASHILELDDIHKASTVHAAAPIIPAALAIAEREHATGESFLLAVALGYEAALRIGEAVNPSHYRYWHPTGTAATFGAAVAAASLLKLDAKRMLDALGSAGTQAAGLWEFNADGAMSKHLHPGKAAFNGILAADLAKNGFTGASRILEGERGFFEAMSDASDPTRVTHGLGHHWKISENCFKVHACCGHTHTAIDIAERLREQRTWSSDDVVREVRSIRIETYGPGFAIVFEPNPGTPYQAKFSLAYCVVVALLEGRVGLEQFSRERFSNDGVVDPAIAQLMDRTTIRVAEDLTAKYPRAWPARLHLEIQDGTVLDGAADFPRGNPENPVGNDELQEKFRALIVPRYGPEVTHKAIAAVHSLRTREDMADLFQDVLAISAHG
jgi:2-methylcitrate dehydratase PrpD